MPNTNEIKDKQFSIDDKIADPNYFDPLSEVGEGKRLKKTNFGLHRQLTVLAGKVDEIDSLNDEDFKELESELKDFFMKVITPITAEEAASYGPTEFNAVIRAINIRKARAKGMNLDEFIRYEKAEHNVTIKAMEEGKLDFLEKMMAEGEEMKE